MTTIYSSAGRVQKVEEIGGSFVIAPSSNLIGKVNVQTEGSDVGVENPFSTDGDSIYVKDIDTDKSDIGTFTGTVTDIVKGISSGISDATATNPKMFTVYFKSPITTTNIVMASQVGKDFSNAKLVLYDVAGTVITIIDNSADNTKYTKYVFEAVPQTFIGYKVEFYTADEVGIAFNYIRKSVDVNASIQAVNDNGILSDIGVYGGHLKTLGFYEAVGHKVTTDDIVLERATGRRTGIIVGDYQLLQEADFIQPAGDVPIFIQSTSANDAAAGTGAQQVTLEYYPFAWATEPISATITLNGATQVDPSITDFYRLHKMYINRGTTAAGSITLTNGAGTILYGQISQYNAFMERCIFYVGTGKKVTCTEGLFSSLTKVGILGRIFASEEDASGNLVPRARVTFEIEYNSIPYPMVISESVSNPNGLRVAIGIAVKSISGTSTGTGTLKGLSETI